MFPLERYDALIDVLRLAQMYAEGGMKHTKAVLLAEHITGTRLNDIERQRTLRALASAPN